MIDQALTQLLEQRAGVSSRIASGTNNVNVTRDLPRIVYTLIGNPRAYTDDGVCGLRKANYQLDVFAADYLSARTVINQVTARSDRTENPGLDGYSGTVSDTVINRIYFGDDHAGQATAATGQNQSPARTTVDVLIDYRETI